MNIHYDGTNEKCPVPLVKLRVMLKEMGKGDTCRLILNDQGSKQDIPKWLTSRNYSYSCSQINDNTIELLIQNH